MKRMISLVLAVFLVLSSFTMVYGAEIKEEIMAEQLKELGLFQGVSETDFDLYRPPTRIEALVMLIRALGKEDEAKSQDWTHPFKDVPTWADKYVGYAYTNGLTKGQSATQFGTGNANAAMYLTFILRALGYSDVDNLDFSYSNPYSLAGEIGVLSKSVDIKDFMRADVAIISHDALHTNIKDSDKTLADRLIESNVFSESKFNNSYTVIDSGVVLADGKITPKPRAEYSLEFIGERAFTNYITGAQGQVLYLRFVVGEWLNGNMSSVATIIDGIDKFVVKDRNGREASDKISISKSGFFEYAVNISPSANIGDYSITYTGNKYDMLDQKSAYIKVEGSVTEKYSEEEKKNQEYKAERLARQKEIDNEKSKIGNTKISKLTIKGQSRGNLLEWSAASYGADYYNIYRSDNATEGFKQIAINNSNSYLDIYDMVKGKTYYYKVCGVKYIDGQEATTKFSPVVNVKASSNFKKKNFRYAENSTYDDTLLKEAKYFGLDGIRWNSNPVTIEDYENNILYSHLTGNYALNHITESEYEASNLQHFLDAIINRVAISYPDVSGYALNLRMNIDVNKLGKEYVIKVSPQKRVLSDKELLAEQKKSLVKAKRIKERLYEDEIITGETSDFEKVKIYNDYLLSLNTALGEGELAMETGRKVLFDTAYSCLLRKTCDCGGRSAGFNLLMHVDGVFSQGLHAKGHVMNRCVLDGKEYFNDWGNGCPLANEREYNEFIPIDYDSLYYDRFHSIEFEELI